MTCARDLSDRDRDRGARFRDRDQGVCQFVRDEVEARGLSGSRDRDIDTMTTSLLWIYMKVERSSHLTVGLLLSHCYDNRRSSAVG